MEQAIKLAIEKGEYWMKDKNPRVSTNGVWVQTAKNIDDFYVWNLIFTDASFWQTLGKSLGWYAGEWKGKAQDWLYAHFEGREQEFWNELIK